jgi:hypothetical protein
LIIEEFGDVGVLVNQRVGCIAAYGEGSISSEIAMMK